jgi:cytidyltransferase-like protein
MTKKIITVSGGFDPVHVGHLRMFEEAAQHGDLVVILNSDPWLTRKKGKPFMSWDDRAEIIRAFRCVKDVVPVDDTDGSVCEALERIKPDVFANGGDRKADNIPEYQVCQRLGIEMIFNIGGGKVRSSSELIREGQAKPAEA